MFSPVWGTPAWMMSVSVGIIRTATGTVHAQPYVFELFVGKSRNLGLGDFHLFQLKFNLAISQPTVNRWLSPTSLEVQSIRKAAWAVRPKLVVSSTTLWWTVKNRSLVLPICQVINTLIIQWKLLPSQNVGVCCPRIFSLNPENFFRSRPKWVLIGICIDQEGQ